MNKLRERDRDDRESDRQAEREREKIAIFPGLFSTQKLGRPRAMTFFSVVLSLQQLFSHYGWRCGWEGGGTYRLTIRANRFG